MEGEYLSRYWLCDCRVVNSFVINWSSTADRSAENCCQLDSQRALLFLQPLRGLINAPTLPARLPAAARRARPGTLPHTHRPSSRIYTQCTYTLERISKTQCTLLSHILLAERKSKSIALCHFESANSSGAIKNQSLCSGQAVKVDKLNQNGF